VADLAAGERDRARAEQLITAAAANLEDHERKWRELWAPLEIEPQAPAEMIEWLERAREVLRLRKEHNDLAEQLAKARNIQSQGLSGANDLAARLDVGLDPGLSLAEAVDYLSSQIDEHEARWGQYRDLTSRSTERQARLDQANRKRKQSLEDQASWKSSWSSLLPRFGLDGELSLAQAERALTLWQDARSTRRTVEGLEHRIKAMRSVSRDYGNRVTELCEKVAPDLTGTPPIEALRILFERLGQQQKQDTRFQELSDRLHKLQEEMATTRDRVRDARSDLAALAELAGIEDPAGLEAIIAKAAERKEYLEKLKSAQDRLVKDGDGFSEEDLRAESEDYSSEDLQRQELAVNQEREQLTAEVSAAAAALEQARRQQADLRAAGTAETASQELHSSLAELAAHARDWARARAASILLKEAIDRFRQEYQNPLLLRAGQLFEAITLGSFTRFAVEYDEKDQPRLVGLRPDGATCPVAGMSDGTRDQLYLSLRIAALEAYCEQEEPLPFVGDDLFVHFDDDRATAGLKMLARLSSCQVLLFTHHCHLVDIAVKNLGDTCVVVEV
jgi:uncharacterized protein YhaN